MALVSEHPFGRVHMIGIGGSSMSGLALWLKDAGYNVTGSDRTASHKTDALVEKGIAVIIGQRAENVHGADIVVYSAAIAPGNPERLEARRRHIPQIERCDLLGEIMRGSPAAVAVAGTHGKTTTTSMLAQIYTCARLDPSVHIGGELDAIGGSTRHGTGDFICEACEYHRSFLHLSPTVCVITNIDEDHLDYYRDIDEIESAFRDFVSLLPDGGWCVACGDDERAARTARLAPNSLLFGLGEGCGLRAVDVVRDGEGRPTFRAELDGKDLGEFKLRIAGDANLMDALAAIAVCAVRGVPMDSAREGLAAFTGAHRRNELTGTVDGVRLYTDYGHNPAEIRSALSIARLTPHRKLWSVWQPHTYSRTKTLFNAFLDTFGDADELLVTDICAAREQDPGDISSSMLIAPLRERGVNAHLTPTFDDAEAYLRAHWQAGDVVITHGCGDIDLLNEQISLHGDTPKKEDDPT